MSATIDVDRFSAYFQHCPVINIPGRTFPVQVSIFRLLGIELKEVIRLCKYLHPSLRVGY